MFYNWFNNLVSDNKNQEETNPSENTQSNQLNGNNNGNGYNFNGNSSYSLQPWSNGRDRDHKDNEGRYKLQSFLMNRFRRK